MRATIATLVVLLVLVSLLSRRPDDIRVYHQPAHVVVQVLGTLLPDAKVSVVDEQTVRIVDETGFVPDADYLDLAEFIAAIDQPNTHSLIVVTAHLKLEAIERMGLNSSDPRPQVAFVNSGCYRPSLDYSLRMTQKYDGSVAVENVVMGDSPLTRPSKGVEHRYDVSSDCQLRIKTVSGSGRTIRDVTAPVPDFTVMALFQSKSEQGEIWDLIEARGIGFCKH